MVSGVILKGEKDKRYNKNTIKIKLVIVSSFSHQIQTKTKNQFLETIKENTGIIYLLTLSLSLYKI